jgi:monoterpene epsilon-lactone hydrolase
MVSQRVNDIAAAAYGSWLWPDATIDDMRAGFDTMCPEPAANAVVREATVGGIPGRWVSVPESGRTVILHFHAGGYLIGSSRSHRDMAARIGRAADATVFLPDYRLAPENPCPAALEDALAAYRGLVHEEGVDPASIVVSGDSAGGGLALALLVVLRDAGDPLPALGFLCSPWADLSLSGDSMSARESVDPLVNRALLQQMADGYLGGSNIDARDTRASALFADLTGLPPLLVQAGTSEVLEDDAVRIVDTILNAGGEAELQLGYEMVHVFQMFADRIPSAQAAIDRIGRFVGERIGSRTMT